MASSANIGFVAQEQLAVPAGSAFVPFCIHGTATSDGTATTVFSLLDANGNAIAMPRAAKLVGFRIIKTVNVGATDLGLAKNGTVLSVTQGTLSALGISAAVASQNIWNSTVLADYLWAEGDVPGIYFSAAAADAVEVNLTFRPV